jgi:hypothetical protein
MSLNENPAGIFCVLKTAMAKGFGSFFICVGILMSASFAKAKTIYILGVDGLSYEAFIIAQRRGYFKDLKSLSGHIAPFPSMTDLSWSEIMSSSKVFGAAGRIRSVEAVHFDDSQKAISGDVRDYYRRLAQPKYYLNAFQNVFNPYLEALMYFPTKELPAKEIQTVIDGMLAATGKEVVTGYVGGIDSMAHTQLDQLFPVIQILDSQIHRFVESKKAAGEDFELVVMSDHGNVGHFQEGGSESLLQPIEIEPVIQSIGMRSVNKLEQDEDVAIPLLALGSWAPVYFKNRQRISGFVQEMIKHEWFDLGVQLLENSVNRIIIKVSSAEGEALVTYQLKARSYFYEPLQGNPLQLSTSVHSSNGKMKALSVDMVEKASRSGIYPDSIIRLIDSVRTDQFDFPDLILSFKDGYYLNNSLGKMTKMYRTHGSLTRAASLGVVASSSRALPPFLRSRQILPFLGVKPKSLFGNLAVISDRSSEQAIERARLESTKGIATGARDFSDKKIFQMISKIVSFSRPYFIVSEIQDLLSAFSVQPGASPGLSVSNMIGRFNPSKLEAKSFIDPVQIGALTDLVIRNPNIDQLKNDPQVLDVLQKLGLPSSDTKQSPEEVAEAKKSQVLGAKRAAMKIYQVPYLLDQALTFQDRPYLSETRDLDFASYWDKNRTNYIQSPDLLNKQYDSNFAFWKKISTESTAERLFREVFKESDIEERIAPQPLNSIYKNVPEKLTIVYVPGTYNGIFDQEIFSLGLLTLKEDLGLRVLKAPILSACSSDVNGAILLKFLKEDQQRFIEKKEVPPKYIILGYSKGAVDALHALIADKTFAQNNIKGLTAIAAPLKGSPILEKADLPFFIVNLLIDETTPEVCKKEKPATSSVSMQGMNRFWRQHERELIGLTRYFSVSFVSEPEDSHLFMKVTKMMAQFDEDNDGIVGLSSSKFPESLQSVDLGVVKADHLSGILSARFNQRGFMRALVRTLGELGVEDSDLLDKWKLKPIYDMAATLKKDQRSLIQDYASKIIYRITFEPGNRVEANREKIAYKDPYELNAILIGAQKDPLAFYEPQTKLLPNQLDFDPFQSLDLAKMPEILSTKRVTPISSQNFKNGIDLSFNHTDFIHYRVDHQMMYESRSPVGGDNNPKWGFQSVAGPDKSSWLALRSTNNSIRLTTLAYRFKPVDFPTTELSLNVTQGPKGADPVKGKSGKDDSAFQVWLTLRDLRGVKDRAFGDKESSKVYTFGYYWGEDTPGEKRKSGQVFENYYSNKNIVVATFPPAFAVVLNNGSEDLNKPQNYRLNLAADIQRAYPDLDINQLEVIAITLQMDSNDTASSSEAFMKTLKFLPKIDLGLDVKLSMNH